MRIPKLKLSFLLIILALSTCAFAVLAIYQLIRMQQVDQASVGKRPAESNEVGDIGSGEQLGIDEYATRVTLLRRQLTSAQMAQLGRLQYLQFLDLSGSRLPAEGIGALKGKDLAGLILHNTNVAEPGDVLATLPHLATLDLSGTPIADATIEKLAHAPTLFWLDVHDTSITDEALKVVADMPKLQQLCLSGTHITDEGLRSLTSAPHLSRIRLLGASVTIQGITTLLKACPTLKYIVFDHCPRIGLAEFTQLTTNFPECKFVNK